MEGETNNERTYQPKKRPRLGARLQKKNGNCKRQKGSQEERARVKRALQQ